MTPEQVVAEALRQWCEREKCVASHKEEAETVVAALRKEGMLAEYEPWGTWCDDGSHMEEGPCCYPLYRKKEDR